MGPCVQPRLHQHTQYFSQNPCAITPCHLQWCALMYMPSGCCTCPVPGPCVYLRSSPPSICLPRRMPQPSTLSSKGGPCPHFAPHPRRRCGPSAALQAGPRPSASPVQRRSPAHMPPAAAAAPLSALLPAKATLPPMQGAWVVEAGAPPRLVAASARQCCRAWCRSSRKCRTTSSRRKQQVSEARRVLCCVHRSCARHAAHAVLGAMEVVRACVVLCMLYMLCSELRMS